MRRGKLSRKVVRPAGLSKAAQMESASEASKKKMKAISQIGGLTISEYLSFAIRTAFLGLTVADFQVTLSA